MKLSKWYFDCVNSEGDAFIGYAATLNICGMRFAWSASRLWTDRESLRQGFTRHRVTGSDENLLLSMPRYDTEGTWGRCRELPPLTLADASGMRVRWQVLRPRAEAALRQGTTARQGTGYVERLDLELPKPVLPFTDLYWGRFFPDAGNEYCIWTGWRGGLDRSWVVTGTSDSGNSGLFLEAGMSETGLEYAGASLCFNPVRILTDTCIGSHIPFWIQYLGGSLIAGRERKLLSRGIWRKENGACLHGWALHEVVRWAGGDAQALKTPPLHAAPAGLPALSPTAAGLSAQA